MESRKSKCLKRHFFALIAFSAITFLCFYKNYDYNENINFLTIESDGNNLSSHTYRDNSKVCTIITFNFLPVVYLNI